MYYGGETGSSAAMPSYFMASFFPTAEMDGTGDPAMDRARLASRNHREAEKRRRERIKYHLDRLRALLACDPKTDKASLLAKAVEQVRDLRQRAAQMADGQIFPSETDEIVVLPTNDYFPSSSSSSNGQRSVFKASLCCEDRTDLLPELIETLRSLRLKTLRAEMATLGGRVRNVLVLAGEGQGYVEEDEGCFNEDLLRDALRELVERRNVSDDRTKRRRIVDTAAA